MQELALFIKHLDDAINEDNAREVISDLIDNTPLELIGDPQYVENKYDQVNCFKFELSLIKDRGFINYYELVKIWCSDRGFAGWLRIYTKDDDDNLLHYQPHVNTRVSELSIGNFHDHKSYIKHIDLKPANSKRILIDFEHDVQKVSCYIITEDEWYKLSFEYTSVEGFVVGDIFHEDFSMYLPIRNPPKVWMVTKEDLISKTNQLKKRFPEFRDMPEEIMEDKLTKEVYWLRQNRVGQCEPRVFGSCSVFQFCIDSTESGEGSDAVSSHTQVIAGFIKHRYVVYFAPIDLDPDYKAYRSNVIEKLLKSIPEPLNKSSIRFSVRYGLLMLVSKGTRFTDKFNISDDIFKSLEFLIKTLKHEEEIIPLIKSFALLCNRLDQRRFIDLSGALQTLFQNEKERFNEKDVLAEKSKNLLLIRRITVTPTRTLFQPPELNTSNRVLRKFNPDNFVRVSFRDEDFGPLNLNSEYESNDNSIIKRIRDLFHNGIQIGDKGRCYKFLGCSNSQLRSAGAWFVNEEGNETVKYMREWVGDFSNERSLSKYVSRLGLAFTTTETLLIDNATEKMIDDIETPDKRYTFSDGIGKISLPIAKKIQEGRELDYLPSAFQIRYGGCKGMVALDPTLGDTEDIIQIRPSMRKFESNHKDIEFCQASKPGLLYMNRQVIWLLRGYNIHKKHFVNLQNNTLLQLAESLKDPKEASQSLMNYQGDGIFKQVLDSGIDLTLEAFHRLQLLSLYRFHVKEVLTRTRIVMPDHIGRQMLGVMDETGTLEYGQVFVQYSKNIAIPGKTKVIRKGTMFISKNPCVHPGDLRTFTALDVPALHHMCDVVVFPSKGKRPHPNELSGSDLDGDEYFVCWLEELIPQEENKEPGAYESAAAKLEREEITPQQLTDHVIKHITKPNNLGKISNAHLVHCDLKTVNCEEAIELAKQHSIAVDYPKTGIPEDFDRSLRVYEYPDWMEKPDKPCYKSTSVVGDCYRICRSLDQVLGEQDIVGDRDNLQPDQRLLYKGYEEYLNYAQEFCKEYNKELHSLMSQYGLESEGDIACGCLNKVKQQLDKDRKKNYDITEECVRFYRALQAKYQKKFFEEFNTKKGEWMEKCERECFKKASAWYLAAYKYVPVESGNLRLLSFPWCVSEVLCELAKLSRNLQKVRDQQPSCTELMINNMTDWFTKEIPALKAAPPDVYTQTEGQMQQFVDSYKLIKIDNEVYGLPYNPNLLTYYCNSTERTLAQLQQDMFENFPGWDKSYLDMVATTEIYLSLRYTPNICVFKGIVTLEKMYTIRRYMIQYPELQIPAALVAKWADTNSLDKELHVLVLDFVLLFIQVLVMERTIDPIKIDYLGKNKKDVYLEEVFTSPVPLVTGDTLPRVTGDTAEYYFSFLKALIYGRAVQSLLDFPHIPPTLKEQNMSLCSHLSSNSTKFVSYAMREYHETCYFLFKTEQDVISKKRGKRNKTAKYKLVLSYPVCYNTDLCARHLEKHSSLEVNMRTILLQRTEVLVIEVWGNTPEVLQDVTESMQVTEAFKRPKYKFAKDVEVEHSHRILLGRITKNKDKCVAYQIYSGEGFKKTIDIKTILDLPTWDNMANSAKAFLRENTQFIRKNHNVYSHGNLAASCEFGRFQPFLNCCEKSKFNVLYANTLRPNTDPNEHKKLLAALQELGFQEEQRYDRIRLRLLYDKFPLTVHCRSREKALELEKVTWTDMTWCEMHMFTERHKNKDRHSHRDMIFNIDTCATLMKDELETTKNWSKLHSDIHDWIQYTPSFSTGKRAVLTKEWLNLAGNDFCQLIYEEISPYVLKNNTRLSKVKFDIVERHTFSYNTAAPPPSNPSWHLIASLPTFDGQSIGLLNEFFETCLKLH